MNREEMIKRVSKWWKWPTVPTEGLPKEPGGWDWVVVDGMHVLTHSIHDPITRADWERVRSPAKPAPFVEAAPAMNREEALQEVGKRNWWPEIGRDPVWGAPEEWSWFTGDAGMALTHSIHDPITRADWERARQPVNPTPATEPAPTPNKYQRTVPSTTIDVYDVLTAYSVTNPATQHAIKKLLQPGNRGHKDTLTDLCEALASIQRAIQIEEQSARG